MIIFHSLGEKGIECDDLALCHALMSNTVWIDLPPGAGIGPRALRLWPATEGLIDALIERIADVLENTASALDSIPHDIFGPGGA